MPKQDVAVELFYDGVWNDVASTDDVYDAPIVIKRGQSDEGTSLRPCSITCTLANDDDMYRTSNPMSPLYGKAGRNTPIRVKVGGTIRGVAEMSSVVPDQTADFRASPPRGKAWVDVEAGGLLQRIGQWKEPLRSALYRYVQFSGVTPAEWWPMEDADGSAYAVSAIDGADPMTPVTTVRYTLPSGAVLPPGGAPKFADGGGISGSDKLPSFQSGGTLAASVRSSTTFTGYAIDWVMQFAAGTDEGGTTSADVLRWRESGTYVMFTVNVVKNNVTVFHSNAADALTLASTGSASTGSLIDLYDGSPHHFRYQVQQNGGNYKAELYIDGTLYATADNFTPGMTGTVGRPLSIEWNPGEQNGDYMPVAAGHLVIWSSGANGAQPALFEALDGHSGEKASYRFGRLCDEQNIAYYVSASYDETMPMGPQRPDTFSNLLKEMASTEDGLIYDYISELRLQFYTRADRYNQTPVLTLTPADLPSLPREVVDDLNVHNIVVASQRDGGDATAEDGTGPLGSQPPPDGVGEYRQTVDVNLADPDNDLPQLANWWMRRGTVDLPRYPQVTVDLNAKPALVTAVEAIEVGSVIEISGFRENTLRLQVLGWVETIGTHSRTITFTCAPDQQFQVGVYGTNRYDLRTCTLDTDSGTALVFKMTADEAWSTTATPYDLMISGERVTVTTMNARTGTGPYFQSANATRSVNSVVKTLPVGAEVHKFNPGRYAL